eukprot:TRINITY_DN21129_c0_g1_i1.p1 TRINITY_DN21129_c0_g1~~TRINITY_DN21129_c0_g1_i1.p1  ORF type:complete len:414 (-),score=78.31 TRINITY_DN21129_c0_g1_i1:62-1303(-)
MEVRIDALAEQQAALRDEISALRECLLEAGCLDMQSLSAKVHRNRFERVKLRHPAALHGSLETVLEAREILRSLAFLVCRKTIFALAVSCKPLCDSIMSAALVLASTLPSTVYVVGGEDDDGRTIGDVECLLPTVGVWEPGPPLRVPRKWCAATAVGGHVYVLGGWDVDDDTLNAVDRLDPWCRIWEEMPAMLRRRGAAAAAAATSCIFAIGGQDGQRVHGTAEAMDLLSGSWAILPALLNPRHASAAFLLEGHVHAVGGYDEHGLALASFERYSGDGTSFGVWEEMPPLRTARAGLAATVLANKAYAVGGCDARGRQLASLERFDPRQGFWEEVEPLVVPRWGLGAVSYNKCLYALGGVDFSHDVSIGACERYTPEGVLSQVSHSPRTSGQWSFVGCLQLPRRLFGAAVTCG